MTVKEYMYIKYVKTAEFQRALGYLNGNKVGKIVGTRSYSKNVSLVPIPSLSYISVNKQGERGTFSTSAEAEAHLKT